MDFPGTHVTSVRSTFYTPSHAHLSGVASYRDDPIGPKQEEKKATRVNLFSQRKHTHPTYSDSTATGHLMSTR